jgi:CDP-glycerol glycerophosphotransferase (TagB/SpsB family)
VDLGSLRSIDMSYTSTADIYIGDVSSQVYEFLAKPRPCIFLNPHGVSWRNDPHYACWNLGEVVDDPAQLMAAVRRAQARHAEFLPAQQQASVRTLGDDWANAPARAAGLIGDFLLRKATESAR